jgi:ech hydrogenase subunit E
MRSENEISGGDVSYSLALGPFHPAWRGPQRFVLRLSGERIADIEYYDGFNERGCAERLSRLDLPQALHLVTRICGACSFAHSLAFCQALEQLDDTAVTERAAMLRSIAAELERIASHLQGAATVFRALGMEPRADALEAMREPALEALRTIGGARVIPDLCLPGGLRRDLSAHGREELLVMLPKLNRALYRLIDGSIDHRALLARTIDVGALPRAAAEQFGVRGPLARASGIPRDARADHPYAGYAKLDFSPITQEGGDLYARLMLLLLEAYESVKLAEQALQQLPEGAVEGALPEELKPGHGTGVVEGPRGMIRYIVESDRRRITNVRIDAPRQLDRLLARTLLSGALIDNAVAIMASTDHCTACAER